MSVAGGRARAIVLVIATLASASALAAAKASSSPSSPMLPGANSKDPISIDADKLNYYDKEQKAIYTGNVVAIQGDSRITCTIMTIFLAKSEAQTPGAPANALTPAAAPAAAGAAPAADNAASPGGTQVRHMDLMGPVTVTSKTQVATGDRGSYDKERNKVWLFGNVTLSDGGNVTKGDRLTYDLTSGEAVVEVEKSHRVTGVFIQGSAGADDKPAAPKVETAPPAADKAKPAKKQARASAATPAKQ